MPEFPPNHGVAAIGVGRCDALLAARRSAMMNSRSAEHRLLPLVFHLVRIPVPPAGAEAALS
jgi:hypothetical protein